MEYCPSDVEQLLKKDRKARKKLAKLKGSKEKDQAPSKELLTMLERIQLAKDAALGMNWLHGINSIVHGDLKSANLLVDENRRVKTSDFGFAVVKKANDQRKEAHPVGTPLYMPPQVMRNEPYDGFKADVYSFGLILWEIATSQKLFSEFDDWEPFKKAVCTGHRPDIPKNIPHSFANLMTRCWHEDPKKRPSFQEIIFRLDEVYVDVVTSDGEGRKFWKDHFLLPKQDLQEEIPWSQFKSVLAKQLGVPVDKVESAKPLLAKEESNQLKQQTIHVPIQHFNQMLHTFGYFFLPGKGPKILEIISDLAKQAWFHGGIEREVAEDRLRNRKKTTFLIRLSRGKLGCPFALSQVGDRGITHRVIEHDPLAEKPVWTVNIHGKDKSFGSLKELLAFPDLKVSFACPPEIKNRYGSDSDEEEGKEGK